VQLAAWRAARLGHFVQFPRSGEWLRLDGTPMTAADWESEATAGMVFRSTDRERAYLLRVDRGARAVTVTDL
jgi:hypothetical protein